MDTVYSIIKMKVSWSWQTIYIFCHIVKLSVRSGIMGRFSEPTSGSFVQENGEAVETMTTKDVYMFPVIASCLLLGLYCIVKVSPGLRATILAGQLHIIGLLGHF